MYDKVRAAAEAREALEVKVQRSEQDMFVDISKCEMPEDPNKNQPAKTPEKRKDSHDRKDLHATTFEIEEKGGVSSTAAIDSKPMIRVRAPPGGKSSIFF